MVPMTCMCGKTLCRDCILLQVKDDKYYCPSCCRTILMKDLFRNRAVNDLATAIERIEKDKNSMSRNRKRKYLKAHAYARDVNERLEDENENESGVQVDKEVEAFVKFKSNRAQTSKSYLLSEQFTRREFGVNISWKYCFMVPVYLLAQSPWILLPILSFNQNRTKMT